MRRRVFIPLDPLESERSEGHFENIPALTIRFGEPVENLGVAVIAMPEEAMVFNERFTGTELVIPIPQESRDYMVRVRGGGFLSFETIVRHEQYETIISAILVRDRIAS